MKILKFTIFSYFLISYAKLFSKMVKNADKNKSALIEILDKIFVSNKKEFTNNLEININIELTATELDFIIVKARDILVKLYITCENDFKNLADLYLTIAEVHIPLQNSLQTVNKNNNYLDNRYLY